MSERNDPPDRQDLKELAADILRFAAKRKAMKEAGASGSSYTNSSGHDDELDFVTAKIKRVKKRSVDLPTHVLIRIKSDGGQTINAHREILNDTGAAILGKFGQPIGHSFIRVLRNQIAQEVETFLFLTTREGWNGTYVTYQCRLKGIEMQLTEPKRSLVPTYYSSDYKRIKTWFEILTIDKMSEAEMNRIFVLSSGRSIMSVITSSATVYYVGLKSQSILTTTTSQSD